MDALILKDERPKRLRVRGPIVSSNTHDPALIDKYLDEVDAHINERFDVFSKELEWQLTAFLRRYGYALTGNVTMTLWLDDGDFVVNSSQWKYNNFNAVAMEMASELIDQLINEYILGLNTFGDPADQPFIGYFVEAQYERGARAAFGNLASQSLLYSESQRIATVLQSPIYSNTLSIVMNQSYEDWRGLTTQLRSRIIYLISEGVIAGISPKELAKAIVNEGIKPGQARNMARTELIGAYRKARLQEGERARSELGLDLTYLWLSALSPTTRVIHARRHGKRYTAINIQEFYQAKGNRYNCKCTFVEYVNNGVSNNDLLTRLSEQRDQWVQHLEAA